MPSRRLPASCCARPIASSTAAISSRRCRPTSTARAITSISKLARSPCPAAPVPCGQARGEPRDRRLGHRPAAARVPARRRLRRRTRVPVEELFPVRHHKCRNGHGPHHRGARRNDRRCRGLSRPHRVRSLQARRNAAQAARCRASDGVGMARKDRTARRHRRHVRLVLRATRKSTMPCAALPSPKTRKAADERARRHRLSRSFRSSPSASTPEKTIRRTIDSVLGQTYPNIEYLVVDGASTDGTLAIPAQLRGAPEFHRPSPIAACTTR